MNAPADMRAGLASAWEDTREQWQSNPRLRYGVYAIIGILWFYGMLVLRDSVTAKKESHAIAEARIARARALANSGDWAMRATEAKAATSDYESLLWKEGSLGLAQAAVQESINRGLATSGLTGRQIKVAVSDTPIAADMAEIVPIRAKVLVDFRPAALNAWLAAMARDATDKKPALIVESISVRGAPAPLADVEIVAYALKPEAIAAKSSAQAQPSAPAAPAPAPTPAPTNVTGNK